MLKSVAYIRKVAHTISRGYKSYLDKVSFRVKLKRSLILRFVQIYLKLDKFKWLLESQCMYEC